MQTEWRAVYTQNLGPQGSSLITDYTVCPDLSVHILRVIYYSMPFHSHTKIFEPAPPICRKSMDSVDSLDLYHGLSGHCPWNQWTGWTMSMDTLDKVQWVHGQSPVRPARLDNVHGFSGHCPWTQSTVWTLSMDSVDIVHGLSGQSGHCPWFVQGVQADWTKSTESMDWLDIVHGLIGLCPVWFG